MPLPPLRPTLNDVLRTVTEALRTGPKTVETLAASLAARAGVESVDPYAVDDVLESLPQVIDVDDHRVGDVRAVFSGLVVTHRLTDTEVAERQVAARPSLEIAAIHASTRVELAYLLGDAEPNVAIEGTGGWVGLALGENLAEGLVDPYIDPHAAIRGGSGWNPDAQPGDLVGVRLGLDADAWVTVPVPDEAFCNRILGHLERLRPRSSEIYIPLDQTEVIEAALLEEVLAVRRLGVLRPVDELLVAAGYVLKGSMCAPAGFQWNESQRAAQRLSVAREWQIDQSAAAAVFELHDACVAQSQPSADPMTDDDRRLFTQTLLRNGVAELVATRVVGAPYLPASWAEWISFLEELLPGASKRASAIISTVLARLLIDDPAGDIAERHARAAALLDQAMAAEPRNLLVLDELIWNRMCANDLPMLREHIREWGRCGGIDLEAMRRGEEPSVPAQRRLRLDEAIGLATIRRVASVGRNDPCPCGSGKKYKQCCARNPQNEVSVARGRYLHAALALFAERTAATQLDSLVREVAESTEDGDVAIEVFMAVDELVALSEPMLGAFVGRMATVLPAVDRELLAEWGDTPLGLWSVVDTTPGRSLAIVDTSTGSELVVRSEEMSESLAPGDCVLTRPLPMGDGTWRILAGAVPVPMPARNSALALLDTKPSPADVVYWIAWGEVHRGTTGGTVRNTENHPLVFCTTRWRIDNRDATAARLDAASGPEDHAALHRGATDGDIATWLFRSSATTERWIRGHVQLDDTMIELSTNSVERQTEITAELVGLLAGLIGAPSAERFEAASEAAKLRTMNLFGDGEESDDSEDDEGDVEWPPNKLGV